MLLVWELFDTGNIDFQDIMHFQMDYLQVLGILFLVGLVKIIGQP